MAVRNTHQTSPARPSVSPLSSPAKTFKSSPVEARVAAMKDIEAQEDNEIEDEARTGEAQMGEKQDGRSSSLSEPDDDSDTVEHENDVDDDLLLNTEDVAARRSLDVDSEAETERLDQTPQKLRKHADSLGRTPSKLSQAATAEEDLSDPPSPVPIGVGAASSTSTVATAGQKRKRSDTADSSLTSADSDLGESPRKRSHEMATYTPAGVEDAIEDAELFAEATERIEDTPPPEEALEARLVPAKGPKGRKGKHKGKKPKELVEELELQVVEAIVEPEEELSGEKPAKTEEELQLKKEASNVYENVAKHFRAFREKLYSERLAAMTAELELLTAQDCAHPEYLRQVASVDARLQKQKSEAHAFYSYKARSIRQRTLGERSQLHSQYYQLVRELREDVLYKLGEDWYAIQRERRQSHQEKDDAAIYKFPAKKSVQIRQQARYNQEVSVLSGVAKYVGFPAAPSMHGVEGDSFEDDMKAMKISKRAHQPTAPARTVYLPGPAVSTQAQNERLAHEQFIEQNAWARPQAPIHAHPTTGISHTPDWAAEPSAGAHNMNTARNLIRNLSGQHRNSSPFATPMPQKGTQLERSSSGTVIMNSDGPDVPSSVLAAPPTTDRISLLHHLSSNQASPLTIQKQRQNGAELTGFRNFSNLSGISGASTIDAPPEPEMERERDVTKSVLPELTTQMSAPQQIFDTSQLHRHVDEGREVYLNAGFRPQEGAFGTPAPLPATTVAP